MCLPSTQANAPDLNESSSKLDKALSARKTPGEAGIDTSVAPALQGAASQLAKAQTKDKVSHGLKDRPTAAEVVNTDMAPALQSAAGSLEHQMRTNKVSKGLKNRPNEAAIVSSGIKKDSNVVKSPFDVYLPPPTYCALAQTLVVHNPASYNP